MKKLLIAFLMITGVVNAQTITNQRQGAERQRWQLLGGPAYEMDKVIS